MDNANINVETTDIPTSDGYQVIITNVVYGRETPNSKSKERPSMTVLDIPDGILKTMKNEQKFKDNVETFVYNTLTKKFGAEVESAQIWLPLENDTIEA